MKLKEMTEQELIQAYLGYKRWVRLNKIGPDDYGGYFWNLIEEKSGSTPQLVSLAIVTAGIELLGEIASRWLDEKMPKEGMDIAGDADAPATGDKETLSCAGCDYLDRDEVPCALCVRSAGYADYYKPQQPPKALKTTD